MKILHYLFLAAVLLCAVSARAQQAAGDIQPHLGYLYPAGAQQGTTVQIIAGGQSLRTITGVQISGEGVHAQIIQYYKPFKKLDQAEHQLLISRLQVVRDQRLSELRQQGVNVDQLLLQFPALNGKNGQRLGAGRKSQPQQQRQQAQTRNAATPAATTLPGARNPGAGTTKTAAATQPVELPDSPLLRNLDQMSLRELMNVVAQLGDEKKSQPNTQIAESVLLAITVDPGAALGNREVRLVTAQGLSNPMIFQVGQLPETKELEPNEPRKIPAVMLPPWLQDKPYNLPITINGQIKPGDVDRFSFNARKGQQLVLEVQARNLIPYLADAVPGWFQPTLSLYNEAGKELAYDDDYRFDPDPVVFYKIPVDGVYQAEIHDAIYRGREDFVYRLSISERPFVTQVYPLGGTAGQPSEITVSGWNLPTTHVKLDTTPGPNAIRQTTVRQGQWVSNPIIYAVDTLPEVNESEPNDSLKNAQPARLPCIINGRIGNSGDMDVYRIEGHAGQQLVAEVMARRLNSPLDSLLRLIDASGKVLQWNDDHEDKESGLLTHQADSCLLAKLPADGVYYVQISDAQQQGGEAYAYRLRLSLAQPDFDLCVTPSSINITGGRIQTLTVHAFRKDGYAGPIDVALRNTPGFNLAGTRIPAGADSVRMTLSAPGMVVNGLMELQMAGSAQIGGQTVSHLAFPAEDEMQAFLPRSLVRCQQLLVDVTNPGYRVAPMQLANSNVKIPLGGTAPMQIFMGRRLITASNIELELNNPPKGISLRDVKTSANGVEFSLKADGGAVKAGYTDNLIVEAFINVPPPVDPKKGVPSVKFQRRSLGFLPAIPFEVSSVE